LGENLQNGKHAHHLVESFSRIQKTKLGGGGKWFWETTFFLMARFAINQNSKMV